MQTKILDFLQGFFLFHISYVLDSLRIFTSISVDDNFVAD